MKIEDAYIGMRARYIDGRVGKVVILEGIDTGSKFIYKVTIKTDGGVHISSGVEKFSKIENEKYYICPYCGELITQSIIDENLELGGSSDCYCRYMVLVWDKETQDFQPEYDRVFQPYREIPENIYEALSKEDNTVLRLRMLSTV